MSMGSEFQICDAEILKLRDPNDKLYRGITSWWEPDEHKHLEGWQYWTRLVRYGGRLVWSVSNVKVASLNCICDSIGSQWSCLSRASGVEQGETFVHWYTTTLTSAFWTYWRWVLHSSASHINVVKTGCNERRLHRISHAVLNRWTNMFTWTNVIKAGTG